MARPPIACGREAIQRTHSAFEMLGRGRLGVGVNLNIVLRPARTPIADWRAIYGGAPVALDPYARVDVEAGRAALATILSRGRGAAKVRSARKAPSVAEIVEARGALLPDGELRLFSALKLASLAQGVSGVRWEAVEALAALLKRDLLPAVPEGANDRLALSHLFAALTGAGEIVAGGRIRPAGEILRGADMRPLSLDPRERSALLSGTHLTLATMLGALFLAERVFQSALVAAAISSLADDHPDTALHLSVHRLNRQRGQFDVATALHALVPHRKAEEPNAPAIDGANADRGAIFRVGAALDLLRQAAALLERAANGVSEDRLVLWQSEEMISGVEDMTSLALAADLIAMSLSTLGALVAERIGASATPDTDSESGVAKATSLAAAIKGHAGTPALEPAGIARLRPLIEATSEIVAIELLAATRVSAVAEDGLSEALHLVSEAAANAAKSDVVADHDIGAVAALIRSGALTASVGAPLPSVAPMPARNSRRR